MVRVSNSIFKEKNKNAFLIFLLISYAISFYLYYIDEGNYHFEGLKQPSEWIFLSMYALLFAGVFSLTFLFVKKLNVSFFGKILISISIGIVALFAFVLILFKK